MTKRPTIKGKGADFFLKQEETAFKEQKKVTFYVPETLVDNLESVWLELRKTHRKLKKSDIARIALEQIFRDYEYKQHDSTLLECLDVRPGRQ